MLRSCLAIGKGIKDGVSALDIIVHNQVAPKTVSGKFSFSKLKIEKVKLFSQGLTKFYYISDFNVGGCLASCFTFRPVLKRKTCKLFT